MRPKPVRVPQLHMLCGMSALVSQQNMPQGLCDHAKGRGYIAVKMVRTNNLNNRNVRGEWRTQ
jgi:hypothetical protein